MKTSVLPIAPAGPLNLQQLEHGLSAMSSLDIPVCWPEGWRDRVMARGDYLAGSDSDRWEALEEGLSLTPKALWMARGGYGCIRTLEEGRRRGYDSRSSPPVPLWGFSDGTALLAAWDRWGWPAWLAPPITQLAKLEPQSFDRVHAAWHEQEIPPFHNLHVLRPGRATGPLAGGNLCVLTSLLSTPWQAHLDDRIVLVEDVGEPAYKVDRLFQQLLLSGALDRIKGLLIGRFTGVDAHQTQCIERLFEAIACDLQVPVVSGLPVGHGEENAPLPFGSGSRWLAHLDAPAGSAGCLSFEPS